MILKKELLLLEKISQWLGVLGNTYRMEAANLSNHRVLRTYAWLTWEDSRGNKNNLSRIHGGNLHRLHVNQRKSLLSSRQILHEQSMKICLHKFPTLAWCSTWAMEKIRCCWWAQQQLIGISISLDFHPHVNTVIALVRPKDVMVYSRGINHE